MARTKKSRLGNTAAIIKISIGLAIIIIGLAAMWFVWRNNNDTPATKGKDVTSSPAQTAIETSQDLKHKKQYDQAAQETMEQYAATKDSAEKYLLALQTATIYETKADYQTAIQWYQQAAEIRPNDLGPISGLARCYDQTGNLPKAVEFYRKTVETIKPTNEDDANDRQYYQAQLEKAEARLQKQQ